MSEKDKSEMTTSSIQGEMSIGPNANYWMALAFSSLWIYLWILIILLSIVPLFVELPNVISNYFTTEIRMWTAFGALLLAGICILKGILLAWTTEYIFDAGQNTLFLKTGILSKNTNAINLRLIYDCDVHQSLVERIFSAGTLELKESDEKTFFVRFVNNPFESRKLIMANSGASSARMISTIS